ncbi:MAG: hypothetical protein UX23_C0002G0033 [Parcubacteria group bacterium GW2011_GWB1_45_9]|nr:MAG: hypothetical protein UX23_C0002G0033 [Parcubacteria group bacterium GW2011_GWB1_45_9]
MEIIITVGILFILLASGFFISSGFYRSYALTSERDSFVSILRKARFSAMNNVLESPHGVFVNDSSYVIFAGQSYASRDVQFDEIISRFVFINVSGLTEVVFWPLSANSSSSGIVTLSDGARETIIEINEEGRIGW